MQAYHQYGVGSRLHFLFKRVFTQFHCIETFLVNTAKRLIDFWCLMPLSAIFQLSCICFAVVAQ
jgi:hypothetical protein